MRYDKGIAKMLDNSRKKQDAAEQLLKEARNLECSALKTAFASKGIKFGCKGTFVRNINTGTVGQLYIAPKENDETCATDGIMHFYNGVELHPRRKFCDYGNPLYVPRTNEYPCFPANDFIIMNGKWYSKDGKKYTEGQMQARYLASIAEQFEVLDDEEAKEYTPTKEYQYFSAKRWWNENCDK